MTTFFTLGFIYTSEIFKARQRNKMTCPRKTVFKKNHNFRKNKTFKGKYAKYVNIAMKALK